MPGANRGRKKRSFWVSCGSPSQESQGAAVAAPACAVARKFGEARICRRTRTNPGWTKKSPRKRESQGGEGCRGSGSDWSGGAAHPALGRSAKPHRKTHVTSRQRPCCQRATSSAKFARNASSPCVGLSTLATARKCGEIRNLLELGQERFFLPKIVDSRHLSPCDTRPTTNFSLVPAIQRPGGWMSVPAEFMSAALGSARQRSAAVGGARQRSATFGSSILNHLREFR